MQVAVRERDLSDEYLRFAAQIGAGGLDFHNPASLPGITDDGAIDAGRLDALMGRIRGFGLDVFRVTPPRPMLYLNGDPAGERELESLAGIVEALGQVGIPFMSMPVHRRWNAGYLGMRPRSHRGGYTMSAFDPETMRQEVAARPPQWTDADVESHFERCLTLYRALLPAAERSRVSLVLHPSDPPLASAEFSPPRWFRVVDDVPSERNGLLYCIGTRQEAGVDVPAEIRALGPRKILHVHFRNVRGTVDSAAGYQEVALDDGDLDMAEALRSLLDIGYRGALQVDHLPKYEGDDGAASTARAVGYIKGLLAACA